MTPVSPGDLGVGRPWEKPEGRGRQGSNLEVCGGSLQRCSETPGNGQGAWEGLEKMIRGDLWGLLDHGKRLCEAQGSTVGEVHGALKHATGLGNLNSQPASHQLPIHPA